MTGSINDQCYTPPTVVDFGDLAALTAGSADGDYLDSDFPIDTKKSDLGFYSG